SLDSHYPAGRNVYIQDLVDLEHPSDTKVLTMKMEILLEPTSNKLLEIRLKMNLPDHRSVLTDPEDQVMVKWRYLIPVESIHSLMLTLNVFNQRQHDNLKTYNTAFATLISNVMIKKSVSMPVRKSQRHMIKRFKMDVDLKESSKIAQA
ncbi:hypothetical protein Tco_1380044, partial [Tanacetum coccineum]